MIIDPPVQPRWQIRYHPKMDYVFFRKSVVHGWHHRPDEQARQRMQKQVPQSGCRSGEAQVHRLRGSIGALSSVM